MAMRGPRLQVGSAAWVAEERSCALQIVESEVEEFSYSARNELDWLNEHMAGIFDENQTNIAETFKTPGKLRGKTPRTARKANPSEARVPLSDVFTGTPNGNANRFAQKFNKLPSPKPQEDVARTSPSPAKSASRLRNALSPKPAALGAASQDSGYFGSQDVYSQSTHVADDFFGSQDMIADPAPQPTTTTVPLKHSPAPPFHAESPKKAFQTTKEDQATRVLPDAAAKHANSRQVDASPSHDHTRDDVVDDAPSPHREESSAQQLPATQAPISSEVVDGDAKFPSHAAEAASDEVRSASDGSSPIRPVVRKSSLNFASLPAREPLTAGKSIGARASRTSHLDNNRKSHYSRPAGEKSLGNHGRRDAESEEDNEMDVDEDPTSQVTDEKTNSNLDHNKTYTQRLQDQINMLGKSQPSGSRSSKSVPNIAAMQQNSTSSHPVETPKTPASKTIEKTKTTPGAFPEDDDDWIEPPPKPSNEKEQSPRPALSKSYSADVMEGIYKKDHTGADDIPSTAERSRQSVSPPQAPVAHTPSSTGLGHEKSTSVSTMPANIGQINDQTHPMTKAVTVPNSMPTGTEVGEPQTPSKTPSRGFRDSPLKQVKNKLSSILKSSKGLLASSAAISAEGKTSMLSPSTSRLALHAAPSSESVVSKPNFGLQKPSGETQLAENEADRTVPIARRTRASAEREKEDKRREKETKRMEDKLEKAREKEREKARVFSKEQERIAAMERQMTTKKPEEKAPVKETPKPSRSSPRKVQRAPETATKPLEQDVEMTDAAPTVLHPSAPRFAGPGQAARAKEVKRPVKPTRETQSKTKQAPTVIRVNTGSQHSQYHSSAGGSVPNAPENISASNSQPQQQQVASKASKATLQTKASNQSLKPPSSVGRPKALDMAAKKKEQDERDAQRRRDAKAEVERKRAAMQEDQRKQEQRRLEAERQKQKEREQAAAHAEAKQNAQRQATIEKAKQTRAPPPAVRSQPNGPPDFSHLAHGKPAPDPRSDGQPSRPPSRMESGVHKPHDESNRPVNAVLSNASKAGVKRTLGPEANDDAQGKRPPSRGGPSYQSKDSKRRRTSEVRDEYEVDSPPNIKGPPVRPSAGFKKELPKKSMFQSGYSHAPSSATRDLFKATVTGQHNSQAKATHPLDMAQISKGAIPFAPTSNHPGATYKTPVRPPTASAVKSTAKAAPKSSPRFQNGESIELPEIETDDEDEDDQPGKGPDWVNSPDLRRALLEQETVDPTDVFGPPAPLNMEEVFNTNKDRWKKFRARTSSANWSGLDRLTEDDIRKDMAARDKLRRDGGWSYELGKDVI